MNVFHVDDAHHHGGDDGPARYQRATRAVFDALADGIVLVDADDRVVDANDAAQLILGDDLRSGQVTSASPRGQEATTALDELLRIGTGEWRQGPGDGANRLVGVCRADRTHVWLELDVHLVDNDAVNGMRVVVLRDVTPRKAAADRMRALSAIVESSSDAIVSLTLDGVIESWNHGAEALFGFRADEALGQHHDLVVPEHRRAEAEHMLKAAQHGQSIDNVLTLRRHRSGRSLDAIVTVSPLRDSTGAVVGISEIAGDVTELLAARDALVHSEARFRSLVQRSSDLAFVFDAEGIITYASPAVQRFGYTPDDLVGIDARNLVHPDDLERHRQAVGRSMQQTRSATVEWRFLSADGSYRWVEEVITDLHDEPAVDGIVANVRDITDRHVAEVDRFEAEERYRQGFEHSAFGLAVLDLGLTITSVNPALADMLGVPVSELLGRRPIEFFDPSERKSARAGAARLLRADATFYKREHQMICADGSAVWVLVDMTLVRDSRNEPSYYFVQVRDITDRKRAEEALAHQALHDDLTHLPNRMLLVDRLTRSLAHAERSNSHVAVLFLDLDRFKLVNDGLGHVVGDELLVQVARRLSGAVRPADTVARFGGDEFVIVREDVDDPSDAVTFAERIVQALHEPVALSGREVFTTASVGIAIGGRNSSAEQLLRDADAAMYRAKDDGRDRIELFSAELQQRVAARLDIETALRHAVDHDELDLLYQPIVRLADGRVVGAEALVRWHRPGHGIVLPSQFIAIAEETGMIVDIGQWVLDRALAALTLLRPVPGASDWPLLAVNLSALQLRLPGSVELVRAAIQRADVDPSMLSLEITESALMSDMDTSARAMRALRELGARVAVDDFGTGYSSLTYLKELPVDALKIDRSFIRGLPDDVHDRSITEAVVGLGNSLGLSIVAEGVENVEQWMALDELACTAGQGFLWSPPTSFDDFVELVAGTATLRTPFSATRDSTKRKGADPGTVREWT